MFDCPNMMTTTVGTKWQLVYTIFSEVSVGWTNTVSSPSTVTGASVVNWPLSKLPTGRQTDVKSSVPSPMPAVKSCTNFLENGVKAFTAEWPRLPAAFGDQPLCQKIMSCTMAFPVSQSNSTISSRDWLTSCLAPTAVSDPINDSLKKETLLEPKLLNCN